jgi:hypothetical protein
LALCLYTDEQVSRLIHTRVNSGRISSVFTVRIKPDAGPLEGLYVARNFLYIEISLTKDLHSARIWATYQEAERWLDRYGGTEPLNHGEVVKVLDMLSKA